jgi:hypothetical protein
MIDYIKYTVDGKTYSMINNGDGTWSRDGTAPSIAGNYLLKFTISENGIITYVDSSNSLYETYLKVVVEAERVAYLEKLVPDFLLENKEFADLFDIENESFDDLYSSLERLKSDVFIITASGDTVTRLEDFIRLKGVGTLEQRKNYILSLIRKGNKLNTSVIKNIANAITGSDCIIKFFTSGELNNPDPGCGYLRVQVLSPDYSKDYRYSDIVRALSPLIPGHIKLAVIKYFATWTDIIDSFSDWNATAAMPDWAAVKDYIPPQ